jgi:hypothetical protein
MYCLPLQAAGSIYCLSLRQPGQLSSLRAAELSSPSGAKEYLLSFPKAAWTAVFPSGSRTVFSFRRLGVFTVFLLGSLDSCLPFGQQNCLPLQAPRSIYCLSLRQLGQLSSLRAARRAILSSGSQKSSLPFKLGQESFPFRKPGQRQAS